MTINNCRLIIPTAGIFLSDLETLRIKPEAYLSQSVNQEPLRSKAEVKITLTCDLCELRV